MDSMRSVSGSTLSALPALQPRPRADAPLPSDGYAGSTGATDTAVTPETASAPPTAETAPLPAPATRATPPESPPVTLTMLDGPAAVASPPTSNAPTHARPRQILTVPSFLAEAPSERIGETTVKRNGQDVRVDVHRVHDPEGGPDEECYKLATPDGKLLGFTMLTHYHLEDGEYGGRPAGDWPSWSPTVRYGDGKLADKIEVDWMASPGLTDGYQGIGTRLHQIAVERMQALGADGLQLTAGWNAQGFHYKMGFRAVDFVGVADGAAADHYIEKCLASGEDTSALGCIVMSLPDKAIASYKAEIDAHPILTKGEAILTDRESGEPVTARVKRTVDDVGLETLSLMVGDEEVGNISLNDFHQGRDGLEDVIGRYPAWSPYASYGRGDERKPMAGKIFAELWDEAAGDRYEGITENLMRMAVETSLDRGYQGRLQILGDWDEHADAYARGFRTEDYTGFTRAEDIDAYIADELQRAEREGRSPNTKVLADRVMIMPRAEAIEHWGKAIQDDPILRG